jgi:DNA-binding GntR family transcriptional regulator
VRIQLETLALRQAIAKGDVTWEANLVAAHHRLAVTPMYFEDGSGNTEWMAAHGAFHAALAAAAGSPVLERLRRQLYDASELYRYWAGVLPHHPTRVYVADEHKAVFDAALARDADLAVDLLTQHLETTARNLEAIAPDVDAEPPALGPRRTDSNRPGTTAPVR